ncbi:outer membrane beta-barrel protein [Ilyobacter sp.]|uniref:outer membrane beta-barrel protein n=1 Tax=Ilyobacter sp. TaxID=3100343 RepID=UPI003562C052
MLAIALPTGSTFAQETYNHWSIQAKGGVNTISGLYKSSTDRDINYEAGGAIEYTISPTIGIGAEYLYLNNDHDWKNFTSNIHQTTVFTSLNLSNLTVPYRSGFWKNVNTYFTVGLGAGIGDFESTDPLIIESTGDVVNLVNVLGMNFEYSINKNIAIGIEPQYFSNTNSQFNPKPYQTDNKNFYTVNLNLRYKIGSGMHMRNKKIEKCTYNNLPSNKPQETFIAPQVVKEEEEEAVIPLEPDVVAEVKKIDTIKVEVPTKKIPLVEPEVKPIVNEKPITVKAERYKTESCNKNLKEYSLVVGSFAKKDNAINFSNKLKNNGSEGIVVENKEGMYRVITYTDSNIETSMEQVRKLRPNYPDIWIAQCKVKQE